MEIKYRDIMLRDTVEADLSDELRWYTEQTQWAQWDAPWEMLEEIKNFDPTKTTNVFLDTLKKEKPEIRTTLELDTADGVHIGTVSSYLIDEKYNSIPRKNVQNGQKVYTTLGIDICESRFWNRGLGAQALTAWILYFLKNGIQDICLQTWSGNLRMVHCAQKLGFLECDRKKGIRTVGSKIYDGLTFCLDETRFRQFLLLET